MLEEKARRNFCYLTSIKFKICTKQIKMGLNEGPTSK